MYLFRSPAKRAIAAAADAAGRLLRPKRRARPDWASVAVIRLDHIGDLVFAEPFLRELVRRKPGARVTVVTTAAGRALLESALPGTAFAVARAGWLEAGRGFRGAWADFWELVRTLARLDADAIVELRGDLRHIAAARLAKPRAWIAGFGVTGGGFLLDAEPPYPSRVHAAERNLVFLGALGLGAPAEPARPGPGVASAPLDGETLALLGAKNGPWIAVHPSTGAPAKAWPAGYWAAFVRELAGEEARFFWVGDAAADERARDIALAAGVEGRSVHLAGRLKLASLGTFLEKCDLFVGADSGPAHVAAAHGVRSLVLFSGTNELNEWKPLSESSWVLRHEVPCSPCHLRACPKPKHYCMEGITPEGALLEARRILHEKSRL
jgi:ADP-heptose:LPS heptosyltransferase